MGNGEQHKALRVLHLFSNCKWTGPAEPALNLCVALRAAGVEADFACAPDAGDSINMVMETARDRDIEPVLDLHLKKHQNPLRNWQDRATLKKILQRTRYDLIHCHLNNDHAIAAPVAKALGIPLVRMSYEGDGLEVSPRNQKLLESTDYLIQPAQVALDADAQHFNYPKDKMCVVPGAIDTERFDPQREVPDGRKWLKIPHDAFVVGIVARMQTHRRYEDLFEALHKLIQQNPNTHLIVVGRGTNQEKVGFQPVRDLGLEDNVHFTGYVGGENYVGMLKALDAGIYLVPGSDGTCRAVREILAMGKPVVAADRGMLREIVDHEKTGYIFDAHAQGLFEALNKLMQDRGHLRDMSRAACATAQERYSLDAQAKAVMAVYAQILSD